MLWNCRYTLNLDRIVVGKVDLCPDHTLNEITSNANFFMMGHDNARNSVKLRFRTYMDTPLLHHLHDLNKEVWSERVAYDHSRGCFPPTRHTGIHWTQGTLVHCRDQTVNHGEEWHLQQWIMKRVGTANISNLLNMVPTVRISLEVHWNWFHCHILFPTHCWCIFPLYQYYWICYQTAWCDR